MFIDSHAHLDGPKFAEDREEVLRRAHEAGVGTILLIGSGTGPGTLDCAIKLAEARSPKNPPRLYATIGIHPHEAQLATEKDYAELKELARNTKVIAIGEIGLDYFYEHSPREVQIKNFVLQLEMAHDCRLPVIIHCRPSGGSEDAWTDCFQLLKAHWVNRKVLFHCFTGNLRQAEFILSDLGNSLISFAGVVTFPKSKELQEVVRSVPPTRFLIETDSPYLAPVPHRGKRNEPAFVVNTAQEIARLRGVDVGEIAGITSENFYSFFNLPDPNPQRP